MTRLAYRILSLLGDFKAAHRGPSALIKRKVRAAAHRELAGVLRRVLR
jgi:hypothetical protein